MLRIPERLRTALEFLVVLAAMSYLFLWAETGSMRAAELFREKYGTGSTSCCQSVTRSVTCQLTRLMWRGQAAIDSSGVPLAPDHSRRMSPSFGLENEFLPGG